jgi:hypothetical protein
MTAPDVRTPGGNRANAEDNTTGDAAIISDAPSVDKRFATLQARLALRGYALHRLTCGGYLIARHDRTSYAPDLRGVGAFAEGL